MGWERKRGKLDEFNRLLRGATDTSYAVRTGDAAALGGRVRADAGRRHGAAAGRRPAAGRHPGPPAEPAACCRPTAAASWPATACCSRGSASCTGPACGRGSPGRSPGRPASTRTRAASSDVYQDLFGWGTFTGKGLYDVDAFAGHGRPGLPGQPHPEPRPDRVELRPLRPGHRRRGVRRLPGQVPRLRPARTPLGPRRLATAAVARADGADAGRARSRTSLTHARPVEDLRQPAPQPGRRRPWSLFLAPRLGASCRAPAWAWTLLALAVLALPLAAATARRPARAAVAAADLRAVVRRRRPRTCRRRPGRSLLTAAFLAEPGGARRRRRSAGRSYRLFVSRRHLLEWETAAAAEARLGDRARRQFVADHVAGRRPGRWRSAGWSRGPTRTPCRPPLPWLLAWLLSPVVAWWVSRPLPDRRAAADRRPTGPSCRRTARKTWRFFETFVTDEDNWLPPDNYQEDPKGVVAHRTSPTNMGLLLLSTLSAHDLGLRRPCRRWPTALGETFDTLDKLERYRGHFLNWYETTDAPAAAAGLRLDGGQRQPARLPAGPQERAASRRRREPVPSPGRARRPARPARPGRRARCRPGRPTPLRAHLAAGPRRTCSAGTTGWRAADRPARPGCRRRQASGASWTCERSPSRVAAACGRNSAAVCPWLAALRAVARRRPATSRCGRCADELNTPAGVGALGRAAAGPAGRPGRLGQGTPAAGRTRRPRPCAAAVGRSRPRNWPAALDDLARRAAGVRRRDGLPVPLQRRRGTCSPSATTCRSTGSTPATTTCWRPRRA